jgi:hypothetical protein
MHWAGAWLLKGVMMSYLNIVWAVALLSVLSLGVVPAQAETMYTRLECEGLDGTTSVWIHSKVLVFDNGKPTRVQTDDPQKMAAQIMEDLYGNYTDVVVAEHAEPFRKTLARKYGMLCKNDVVATAPNRTVIGFEDGIKLADPIWIEFRKEFFNIDLEIRVIDYPEE